MVTRNQINTKDIIVGIVGLGLMGSSIAVALLIAGHPVVGIAPIDDEKERASLHIKELLLNAAKTGLLKRPLRDYLASLTISDDYHELDDCQLVLECVLEDIEVKKEIYRKITRIVERKTIIATNTSAIPISVLQQYVAHPENFIGIHWSEPAFVTRFMEITKGNETSENVATWIFDLAHCWGKEPTLLKKDIRGFITNRLMYSAYRETFSLVEKRQVSIEDIDKAFRYGVGSWITLMGIFGRMDFEGLKKYETVFNNIFPELTNSDSVPDIMQRMVDIQAKGIHNCHGLYDYTQAEAEQWDKAFASFNKEIYHLSLLYPSGKTPIELTKKSRELTKE
ncbi:MAG: 3-hydroxyacyl-CoA dehydrogenase family protein [Chitinophagaceae bacterium]|nr:MAG: 3-hydroxyacyl-CoA dehydrogenase family protein [Chitinophagaceae bacterium]